MGPLEVLEAVARVLRRSGIRYFVGGSVASSTYGVPRSTLDIDLVAELRTHHAAILAAELAGDFYVDEAMVRDAIATRRPFNIIHRESMYKVDIFVLQDDAWSLEEMNRARTETIEGQDGPIGIPFASPEDILLHKLVWYKLGDEASDRQWGDIAGLMKVHGPRLDDAYLDRWAPYLAVERLLARARTEHR